MVFLTSCLRRWLLGQTPLVQTRKYLEADPIHFRNSVQVMLAHFNEGQSASEGLKQFCVWTIPQIQFKNPHVQVNILKEMTPSPWLQFHLHDPVSENEESILVDCYGKSREQIQDHIRKVLGKTPMMLKREAAAEAAKSANPANFGYDCGRWCICEVDGQVPCPAFENLPPMKRWKYFRKPEAMPDEVEEWVTANEEKKERNFKKYWNFTPTNLNGFYLDVYHEENKEAYKKESEFWKKKMSGSQQ